MESKRELSDVVNFQNGHSAGLPPEKSARPTKPPPPTGCLRMLTSWRWRVTILMHVAMVIQVLFRLNMSIAIVCMVEAPSRNVTEQLAQNRTAPNLNASWAEWSGEAGGGGGSGNSSVVNGDGGGTRTNSTGPWDRSTKVVDTDGGGIQGEFNWESSIQGLILSSSNMLGFITPLMTDFLSRHIGGKRLLLIGMVLSALLTVAQPQGARVSPYVLIVIRLFIGLIGGIFLPLISEIFSWWSPELEKVSMVAFVYAGLNIGNMVVGVTSGYLCAIPIDNGWPFIFYVQGALGLLWCLMWQLFGSIRPEDHPFVSEDEQLYITTTRVGMDSSRKRSSPPYKKILKSLPVWAFLGVMVAHYYNSIVIFTYLPKFLRSLFRFSIEEVGVFTSVMYVARFIGAMLWGQVSNLILTKTRHGTTFCRKLVQCSGFYVCVCGLVTLGFLTDKLSAMFVLVIVMISQSCSTASAMILPLDIAPRYSGFLSGLFITFGTIASLPAPVITSIMTSQGTLEEWRNVFIIMAVIFFVGSTWFLFSGSAKLQDWAIPADSTMQEEQRNPNAADLMNRRMTVLAVSNPISPTREKKGFDFTITIDPNEASPPPQEKSRVTGPPSYTNPGFEPDIPNGVTTEPIQKVHNHSISSKETEYFGGTAQLQSPRERRPNGIAARRISNLTLDVSKAKESSSCAVTGYGARNDGALTSNGDVTRNDDTAANEGDNADRPDSDGDRHLRVSPDESSDDNIVEQTRL